MAATSTTHSLLESRRRAYLLALGIPLYHPRRQLAGAQPSLLLAPAKRVDIMPPAIAADSTAERAAVVAVPGVTPAAIPITPSVKPAAIEAALAQLQASPQPAAQSPAQPVTQPAAAVGAEQQAEAGQKTTETPAFAFAFVPVNEQIAVISELPSAGTAMLTPGSRQLLAGILKALTLPCEERHLSSLNFVWPLPDLPPAEQGAAAARELLKGFLAQRFRIRPVRYLLVFAEQSAPYLFADGFALPQGGGVFRHPDFDVDVLVTRSLGAMEAVPALKRDVWAALQPLLAALKNSSGPAQRSVDEGPDA